MRLLVYVIMGILLFPAVAASHNVFDPYVTDISWFDRELYFGAVRNGEPCLDLSEYYAYADSDPYDKWNRDSILRYKGLLSYEDYQRLADEDRSDNINPDDFDRRRDFKCSTEQEFNIFADANPSDKWDREAYYRGFRDARTYNNYLRHPTVEPYYTPYGRSYTQVRYGGLREYFGIP